jgi:hypothetical protein
MDTERIRIIAEWWTQANEASRFELMRRVQQGETKDATLEEVQLGALLAEAEAGEIEGDEAQEGLRGR